MTRLFLLLFLFPLILACAPGPVPTTLPEPTPFSVPPGYARATAPASLQFPRDEGPHPDYQTEWWYYTGVLESEDNRPFGYQLTFFRRALLPPDQRSQRSSAWAANDIYLAHFAVSDIESGTFQAFERYERGAQGLAGAQIEPFRVWLHDWEVQQTDEDSYHLSAQEADISLDLTLSDQRGKVLQGENGFSPKGSQPGNASYYYSQPRLQSQGILTLGEERYSVEGWTWMDHEYSTSALSPNQIGWDWFGLHLDDGSDLMVFQIRRADGSIDPFSSGSYIPPAGESQQLSVDDFSLEVLDTWRSPHSDARYPSRWRLRIPSLKLDLEIQSRLSDQELNLSYAYWEGVVDVRGEKAGQPLQGQGYMELTGYAQSMAGQF